MAGDFDVSADDVERLPEEQLQQLYIAFCVGFFQNNLFPPKETDLAAHDAKLKRLFRTFCSKAYDLNPIAVDYMTPEKWVEWTWTAMQLSVEIS